MEGLQLTFQPSVDVLAVNFTIISDTEPEDEVEVIEVNLRDPYWRSHISEYVRLGANTTATVHIVDDDCKSAYVYIYFLIHS